MSASLHLGSTVPRTEAVLISALPALGSAALTVLRHALRVFTLPFDLVRTQYSRSVQAGLMPNSILASRDLEVTLDALEQLMLGALARRV